MGKPREAKTKNEVQHVLDLMKSYGSIDYAQQRAKSLADQAQRGFQEQFAHLDSPSALIAKSIFSNLIRFIIERQH